MGAWSGEPFGNDTAADWAWELDDASDWDVVRVALDEALNAGDFIDSDIATNAIAAAEVVGRALNRSGVQQPDSDADSDEDEDEQADDDDAEDDESVTAFLDRVPDPSPELVQLALTALDAASGPSSELTALWVESGVEEWNRANSRVRTALGG